MNTETIQSKIQQFYDNAFLSIINDNRIRKAFKIGAKSIPNLSEWISDVSETEKDFAVTRRECVIDACSFSAMISPEGSCSIVGISLNTNRMVEVFVSAEGYVSLVYNVERTHTGAIKKSKGKVFIVGKEINQLQHLIEAGEKLDLNTK